MSTAHAIHPGSPPAAEDEINAAPQPAARPEGPKTSGRLPIAWYRRVTPSRKEHMMTLDERRGRVHSMLQGGQLPQLAPNASMAVVGGRCIICHTDGNVLRFFAEPPVELDADCFALWQEERMHDFNR